MSEKQLVDGELYESRFRFKERRSNARFYLVLLSIILAILVFHTHFKSIFSGVTVDGASMSRTLTDGDNLLMRYADGRKKAERGDVIVVYVYHYPEFYNRPVYPGQTSTKYLIKRLIAIEGDKVKCKDGQVSICYAGTDEYVDLYEPYAYYGENEWYKTRYDFEEYEVGEGEIFFLGDNRSSNKSSSDSRYKENHSSLDCLYKETDIYGVVPEWAIKQRTLLEALFFPTEFFKKLFQ